MSGSEVAAVIVAVTAGIALTLLVVVVVHLLRTVRELTATVESLRVESLAVVEELHETARVARQADTRLIYLDEIPALRQRQAEWLKTELAGSGVPGSSLTRWAAWKRPMSP